MHRRTFTFVVLAILFGGAFAQAQSKSLPLSSLSGYWQLENGNDICPTAEGGTDDNLTQQPADTSTPAMLQVQVTSDEFKVSCVRGTHVRVLDKFFADGQEYPNESSNFAEKILTKAVWESNTLTRSGAQSYLFGDNPRVDFVYSRWAISDDEKTLTVKMGDESTTYHRREAVTKNIYWLLCILPVLSGMVLYLIMSGNNEFLSTLADILGLFAGVTLAVVILIMFSGASSLMDLARVLLVIVLGTGLLLWWIKTRAVAELDSYNFDFKKWST